MHRSGSDSIQGPAFVGAAAVFTLCVVLRAFSMTRALNVYDEGLILNGAMRVANGDVPHRDFYANYGPAQFYVIAALFKLFGPSVLIERVWDTLVRATTAASIFLLVRRVGTSREAVAATALVAIWLVALGFEGFPIFPVLLCAFGGALCLMPFFEGASSRVWLFAAGLCAGIATLFRYDAGFYVSVTEAAVVVAYVMSRPGLLAQRLRKALLDVAALATGVAVICMPVAVAFVASGTVSDFAFDVLVYPATLYSRMRSLPFPRPAQLWADPTDLAIYLPIVVWGAAAYPVLRSLRAERASPRAWLVVLLVLLSALFYLKGVVRVSLIHMTLSIIPALVAAALLHPFVRGTASRIVTTASAGAGMLFILVPTIGAVGVGAANAVAGIAWAKAATTWAPASEAASPTLAPCHPQDHLGRMACFALSRDRAEAIRYVASQTRPNDRIFVGTGRHDIVFANDNLFYFLAGRRPATKWSHYDPGLQTGATTQREMISELRKTRPRLVVIIHDFDKPPIEPNESGRSSGVTLLDDFLRATYVPVRTFGSASVLTPRP